VTSFGAFIDLHSNLSCQTYLLMCNIKILDFFIIVSLGIILSKTRRLQTNSNNLSMIVHEKIKPDQIYTLIDKAYYVDQIKYKIDI
jgi:hypothetical protein